jgi:hypothetical protein
MGSQTKSQTQSSSPWGPSVPSRNTAISEAGRLYQNTLGPQAPTRAQFTTNTPATSTMRFNPSTAMNEWTRTRASSTFDEAGYNAALQKYQSAPAYVDPIAQAVQRYQGALGNTPLENNAYNELNDVIQGKYLQGNPYIEGMIGRTNAGVNAQFSGAGRYGSGAHQGYLADSANALRYQNYGDERANMMQGLAMAPQTSALRYQPYELGINLAQELEDIPANRLARYVDILNAASGGGGSVTAPIYRNRTAGALSGALSGGVGAAMAGASNPWIGAAALAGGLSGFI